MAKATYPVLMRLIHDGEVYDPITKPGITVEMDEDAAAELPDGVLGEGVEPKKKPADKPAAT